MGRKNLSKISDYSTPNRKKRFVDSELRWSIDTFQKFNPDKESYLDGVYGRRRRKAILNCLDKAEEDFSDFGLKSVTETFVRNELMPFSNYNQIDQESDLRIGAALWILEKIRENEKMLEAYKILPDVSDDLDAWCLPLGFNHPCFSNDLIQSVAYVITKRYPKSRTLAAVLTQDNASARPASDAYTELLNLLPEKDVENACNTFRAKIWELVSRYMKGEGYYNMEMDKKTKQIDRIEAAEAAHTSGIVSAPLAAPVRSKAPYNGDASGSSAFNIFDPDGFAGQNDQDDILGLIEDCQELEERRQDYEATYERYLQMDRKTIRQETGSRLVAEAMDGFTVENPYALCFALFYLIDHDDDMPWLIRSGSILMRYCQRMLPWFVDMDDWDEEEWEAWYDGLSYNQNGWMDRDPVPDSIDYLHTKHNGQNLAQVIYGLCRGVIPMGMHPFEQEKKQFITEGMDETVAQKITDTAELLFLTEFQATHRFEEDWDELPEPDEEESLPEINDHPQVTTHLGGYWGKITNQTADDDLDVWEPENTKASEEDNENLKAELGLVKKQLKQLKNALAVTRQEANSERTRYERELKALRLEHRELADLRALVFNSEVSEEEQLRREKVQSHIAYPYTAQKRTVIFGGHENWLKAIRPMLPDVKFVSLEQYSFSPELVRNADVVWVQTNCISHTQYGNIVKQTRRYGIQLRYFGYASAEKCAEQLVIEDQK